MMTLIKYLRLKKFTIIFIFFLIPLGLSTKYYSGIAENWINNSLGGILYIIFFSLFFSVVIPQIKTWKISIFVFVLTSIIEILQLWHPPFLEAIRSNFLGRTLLGNCFVWSDFFYYFIGMILAIMMLHLLKEIQ